MVGLEGEIRNVAGGEAREVGRAQVLESLALDEVRRGARAGL